MPEKTHVRVDAEVFIPLKGALGGADVKIDEAIWP
jgi:hypothetical protein